MQNSAISLLKEDTDRLLALAQDLTSVKSNNNMIMYQRQNLGQEVHMSPGPEVEGGAKIGFQVVKKEKRSKQIILACQDFRNLRGRHQNALTLGTGHPSSAAAMYSKTNIIQIFLKIHLPKCKTDQH